MSPICRICNREHEIDILYGCSELAKTEYTQSRNRAVAYSHWEICHYNNEVTDKYCEHEPTATTENNEPIMLWDVSIQTDKEIKANRHDKVVIDKKKRTCQLTDMSFPTERNTSLNMT